MSLYVFEQLISLLQEIFGPVLTVYVYPDVEIDETLRLVDTTTAFALTGSIFATDKYISAISISEVGRVG